MKRNQRKIQILQILSNNDKLNTHEIHNRLKNTTLSNVSALLLKYYRWHIVNRKKENGYYYYSINKKGKERLNYLLSLS